MGGHGLTVGGFHCKVIGQWDPRYQYFCFCVFVFSFTLLFFSYESVWVFFFFFFCLYHKSCMILVTRTGIEPVHCKESPLFGFLREGFFHLLPESGSRGPRASDKYPGKLDEVRWLELTLRIGTLL